MSWQVSRATENIRRRSDRRGDHRGGDRRGGDRRGGERLRYRYSYSGGTACLRLLV